MEPKFEKPRDPLAKILSLDKLLPEVQRLRTEGYLIGTTNGCFDILHWGHMQYLNQARQSVDKLVILVNSDASVKKLKGPARPIQHQGARQRQLAGLESVDFVCLFDEATPEAALAKIAPHYHFKGGDYRPDDLPETGIVKKGGGQVRCLKLEPGYSTTGLIQRILETEANQ